MQGKEFSIVLKELIKISEVKYSVLADGLGYDNSYISKWISGKVLPAERSSDDIIYRIVSTMLSNMPQGKVASIQQKCKAESTNDLYVLWTTLLKNAYLADKTNRKQNEEYGIRISYFEAICPQDRVIERLNTVFNDSKRIAVCVDLSCLNKEALLKFLGVYEGTLLPEKSMGSSECSIEAIINVNHELASNNIFMFVSIMHLICAFSYKGNINMYISPLASGKIIAVDDKNGIILNALFLEDSDTCVSFFIKEDKVGASLINDELMAISRRRSKVLQIYTSKELILGRDYLKLFLSPNGKWLVGHITELWFSEKEIYDYIYKTNSIDKKEKEQVIRDHHLIDKMINKNEIRILIYETAISDFVLNGDADLYNYHVNLSIQDRISVIKKIIEYSKRSNVQLRLIAGGFSEDFKHAPNPCFFSSSTGSFLRVENGMGCNNVFSVVGEEFKRIIDDCFEVMWKQSSGIVCDDLEYIHNLLQSYIDNCKILGQT